MNLNIPHIITRYFMKVWSVLNNFEFPRISQITIFLGMFMVYSPHGFAASTEPTIDSKQSAKVEVYQSVFIVDPKFGNDPFFPNSKRRMTEKVQPTSSATPAIQNPIEIVYEGLELKGISLGASKKLAIINNYTFAAGEKRNVKVGNQVAEVRCISIQERSVSVMINGRTRKDLTLRDGL